MRYIINRVSQLCKEESGMGVVEIILIIIVLIGLVIIFQDQITKLVDNIFKTVSGNASKVK